MKKFLFSAVALLCALTLSNAQQMVNLPNDPAVRQGKLDNGLTYYIRHNDKPAQRAEFYLATHAGALLETPDQDGLAHFLEHMCFNGTKNFPDKKLLEWLQSIGASFGGNVNAGTGVEQTVYMLTNIPLIRPTVVDSCILIMHDYSHFVTCDPKEIDAERGVILEEKRTRNTASWRMRQASSPYIYGDTKYASTSLIGSEENLKNFKPESLVKYYKTWYQPCNQALIVVGDIDVDTVEATIKSCFADVPAAVNPTQKPAIKIPDNNEPVIGVVTDPEASNCQFTILWKTDPMPLEYNGTAVKFMTTLLQDLTYNIMNERFNEIAVKSDAPFISAFFAPFVDYCESMNAQYASVATQGGKTIEGFKAFMMEMEKMKRFGFSEDEIARAKAQVLTDYENAVKKADTRKNPEFVQPLIQNFFSNMPYMEPAVAFETAKMIFSQVNSQVINQTIQSIITDKNLVVVYNGPQKEDIATPTVEQLSQAIAEVKAAEIAAPKGEEIPSQFIDPATLKGSKVKSEKASIYGSTQWILKNGVTVILKKTDFEKNDIDIELYKKGGLSIIATEDMPSFESNIWSLYQANSGVGKFSANTISKMKAGKTFSWYPFINDYTHGVAASAAPADLELAFQILYLQFTEPRFDPEEYNQGIRQIEAVLPNLESQPNFKFSKAYYNTVFGNPRKLFIDQDVLSKAKLETLERVVKNQLFNDAAGAVVTIVGDFDFEAVKPLVEKYIGSLPKGRRATDWKYNNDDPRMGVIVEDFKTVMQAPKVTVLQQYLLEKRYSVESEVSFKAVKYYLDMLYTDTLREEEGGTYGAGVGVSVKKAPHEFVSLQISFDTNPEQADKLRQIAVKGIQELAKNGPAADKFEMTVNNFTKNIPESRIKNSYWTGVIHRYTMYGHEYDQAFEAAVKALTPEKIQAAAAELVAAGNFTEVIMRPETK